MNVTYALPDLAYNYGALEPHISGKVMELHPDVAGRLAAARRIDP